MYDSANPYLTGNYAPWREEGDAFDLEIEGELPRELNGALYRIGRARTSAAGYDHWFVQGRRTVQEPTPNPFPRGKGNRI